MDQHTKIQKALVLGNEAAALGAIHAGISGVYAYPGTPSTEVTEFIQGHPLALKRKVKSTWCTNEKTAMESALGMSYVGKRALAVMKHVGLNVAADAFVNSAMTGVNGGVVVMVCDDPSMHSSQNEQDSRFYGKFAMIPTVEPSSQQEAYDIIKHAFELSERVGLPVLLRMTTRLAHSRAAITTSEILEENEFHFPERPQQWILLPAISRKRYDKLVEIQYELGIESRKSLFNQYANGKDKSIGVIACGVAYNYLMEAYPDGCPYPVYKVAQYPLDRTVLATLTSEVEKVLVLEDGQPFVEEQLAGIMETPIPVIGRLTGLLPRTGELTPDNVRAAFGFETAQYFDEANHVASRPPALCTGCGHFDMYSDLNEVLTEYPNAKVFSDIGCYTLGALPPLRAIDSCVDMGASITMARGAADGGLHPSVAVIGDSTFTHSGMTGLLDAINVNADMTVIISDNLTTAMTGGQKSAGTNKFEAICEGLGLDIEHLHVVIPVPKNREEIKRIMKQEIDYHGISVIIPRRDCIQQLLREKKQDKTK